MKSDKGGDGGDGQSSVSGFNSSIEVYIIKSIATIIKQEGRQSQPYPHSALAWGGSCYHKMYHGA